MKSVPIGEFKDNASAWIAAAEAGEEIVVTRHGKPAAKLVALDGGVAHAAALEAERRERQRVAVHALFEAGREHRAKYGSVSSDQIIAWIKEDQR
ncbi:MAG: type II toxin-antitoxin system prevent-host-death family antitoxin [Sphingomonadaceae bacterium]|nr:type II toxin-antitoxin system prevent-host-death family antitoxin [Sphingomonadaceae bacterium]